MSFFRFFFRLPKAVVVVVPIGFSFCAMHGQLMVHQGATISTKLNRWRTPIAKRRKFFLAYSVIACVLLSVRVPVAHSQNVGIGTATPNNSALLEILSTSQGFLAPRMTQAQRNLIPAPATGDLVYCTDSTGIATPETFYYYNGIAWVPIMGTGWLLAGNAGTIAGTNFFGTTDSVDLVAKTNSVEGWRLTAQGNLGIGTSTPTSILQTVASGAQTSSYIGNLLTTTATTSTASINKYGTEILSTGGWSGTSDTNFGLLVNATGGTTNLSGIFQGGDVAINTTAPVTYVDDNGDMALNYSSYTASNGANNDISVGRWSFVRITGPTASYSITGVAGGVDGKTLILFNSTSQQITISNEDTGSTAADRIWTLNSTGDIVIDGKAAIEMIYSAADSRWIVLSASTVSTSGTGLLFAKKPTDQSLTTTTLTNDNDLHLAISANDSMVVEGYIHYHNTGSSSLQMAVTVPTGATMDIVIYTDDVVLPPPETWTLTSSGTSTGDMAMNAVDIVIHYYGVVITGSNSGKIQIQWAQAKSSSTPVTFKAKSYIRGTLIR